MKLHRYEEQAAIEEVGDRIYRAVIPQPFYAPNNIYIIRSDEPALIDSGYIQNMGLLQRALRKIGLSFSRIRHVFYTHNHIDHISGSLTLRAYSSAKHYGMAGMASRIGNYMEYMETFQRAMSRLIYKAMPDPAERKKETEKAGAPWNRLKKAFESSVKVDPILKMDVELVEGDVIDIGGRLLGFMHTPGHNSWHLSPYILGEGIYFTGDLILNNISAVYAELDGNLEHYLRSLERIGKIPVKRILPAHGDEPKDPKRAAKALHKTLTLLERGVIRRLKSGEFDLQDLVLEAMGEKVRNSPYYVTALGIIHAIVLKHAALGNISTVETDPPYEKYLWSGK